MTKSRTFSWVITAVKYTIVTYLARGGCETAVPGTTKTTKAGRNARKQSMNAPFRHLQTSRSHLHSKIHCHRKDPHQDGQAQILQQVTTGIRRKTMQEPSKALSIAICSWTRYFVACCRCRCAGIASTPLCLPTREVSLPGRHLPALHGLHFVHVRLRSQAPLRQDSAR